MTATALRPRTIAIRPAPDVEPPALSEDAARARYVEAARGGLRLDHRPAYVQGSLAIDFRDREYDPHFGPQATARADLPDPQVFATRLLTYLLECAHGARSPRQLVRWMTPQCQDVVAHRHRSAQRRGGPLRPPAIRRVLVCEPSDGVAEISAVVLIEGRPHAIAMRLNGADGRWLATELVIG